MKFNSEELRAKAERLAKKHGGPITINLPFISFDVNPDDIEKEVARELLIRLPNKRVLSSKECCDNCIDNSLASIQEIRGVLVDKQVHVSHLSDGPLYLLIEYMAEAVRQFLTFSESLSVGNETVVEPGEFYRPVPQRELYFEALEGLRFHFHSCIIQLASIADMSTPKVDAYLRSENEWQLSSYQPPVAIGNRNEDA
jgi:hypothetical protein